MYIFIDVGRYGPKPPTKPMLTYHQSGPKLFDNFTETVLDITHYKMFGNESFESSAIFPMS